MERMFKLFGSQNNTLDVKIPYYSCDWSWQSLHMIGSSTDFGFDNYKSNNTTVLQIPKTQEVSKTINEESESLAKLTSKTKQLSGPQWWKLWKQNARSKSKLHSEHSLDFFLEKDQVSWGAKYCEAPEKELYTFQRIGETHSRTLKRRLSRD